MISKNSLTFRVITFILLQSPIPGFQIYKSNNILLAIDDEEAERKVFPPVLGKDRVLSTTSRQLGMHGSKGNVLYSYATFSGTVTTNDDNPTRISIALPEGWYSRFPMETI